MKDNLARTVIRERPERERKDAKLDRWGWKGSEPRDRSLRELVLGLLTAGMAPTAVARVPARITRAGAGAA